VARRTRTSRGALLLAASIAVAAGCGLDAIATGPAAAVAPGEAGANPASDADVDSDITVDGSSEPSEGSVVFLPPVDGGADGPTGLPGFCASQALYVACWDFDNALPGGDAGFSDMTGGAGSFDIALEGANAVLQATLPTSNTTRNAWVRYPITNFGQLRGSYQLDYKFGVRQSSIDYVVLGALWATTVSKASTVGVASYNKGAFLDMVSPDQSPARLTATPGPLWHTASITLDGPASALHGVVTIDGAVKVDDETINAGTQSGTGIDLRLGAYYTFGNGGITVVFDDIVVRAP
jgi:hypothetical protein